MPRGKSIIIPKNKLLRMYREYMNTPKGVLHFANKWKYTYVILLKRFHAAGLTLKQKGRPIMRNGRYFPKLSRPAKKKAG